MNMFTSGTMLRTLCSKVLATEQTVLPSSVLVRCLRGNYCTLQNEDHTKPEQEQKGKEYSHCRVSLLGRVGAKPEEKEGKNGSTYARLVLGVSQTHGTNWHRVHVNTGKAWLLEHVDQGDRLYVYGSLRYYTQTGEDGKYHKTYIVQADKVSMISRNKANVKSEEDISEDEKLEGHEH